jgi:hypothetical protein
MTPPSGQIVVRRPFVWLALIGTLALAVRLWGLTFGLPHVLTRPDELFIFGVVMRRLLSGIPNPDMFDYPGLYLYFVAGLFSIYYGWLLLTGRVRDAAGFQEAFRTDWEPFFLLVRAVNAVLGAATVLLCYAIAAPVFGLAAGLLSALFMALAFLHVRDSHYATTDIPMAFFIMCAMLAVVRVHQERSKRDAWLAGIMGGFATGTKYNAVVLVAPMVVVEVLHAWTLRQQWRRILAETHLLRMGLAFAAVFAATSPYLFLDYQSAMEQLRVLHLSTTTGMTPPEMLGRGWTYHLPYSLRYGLGLPLLAAGLGGLVWMAIRRPAMALVLGAFPVTYYAAAGAGYNVFVRYMIPVVPFLCIFAGYAIAELAAAVSRRMRIPQHALASLLGIAVVLPSVVSVVRFDSLMAREDNRVVAARWIHEHVPAGSSIYMSGNLYGHAQLEPPDDKYRQLGFDRNAQRFTLDRRAVDDLPDWIVVQRSALPFSHVPPKVVELLAEHYQLAHVLSAADLAAPGSFYDIQDGFYAPYAGFKGVRRPGPNFEIYRRHSSGPR